MDVVIKLTGDCAESDFWNEVRKCAESMADALLPRSRGWSVTLRRKVPEDDVELLEGGDVEDPSEYWAVFIHDDMMNITIGVPTDGDADLSSPTATAHFLFELLEHVALSPLEED